MVTTNTHVYAVGDCAAIDYTAVWSVLFTYPQ
jgi:hypothetical protein